MNCSEDPPTGEKNSWNLSLCDHRNGDHHTYDRNVDDLVDGLQRRTHNGYLHCLDHRHQSLHSNKRGNKLTQELYLRNVDVFLRSLHCGRHCDDELKLRRLLVHTRQDCWNTSCMITGTLWHKWSEGMPSPSPLTGRSTTPARARGLRLQDEAQPVSARKVHPSP